VKQGNTDFESSFLATLDMQKLKITSIANGPAPFKIVFDYRGTIENVWQMIMPLNSINKKHL